MAGIFSYKFKENYRSETCVVKYWFGKKYFIWKAKHLKQSCDQVFRDLNTKIMKGNLPVTDLFYKVVQHQKRSRVTFATVEVLLFSNNFDEILAFDKAELDKSAGDPNCLNLNSDQYIPQWLQTAALNKPLQAIISPPAEVSPATEVKTKPQRQKSIQKEKQEQPIAAEKVVPTFDLEKMQDRIKKIQAAKAKIGGKN
jgi:hypothetical protein